MAHKLRAALMLGVLIFGFAAVAASADVCVRVDDARDTLSPADRTAALLLLARQFELAGERVVADGCPNAYLVSHVQFGTMIVVSLSGPTGRRDATALGMDDVPAIYSQMIRSLLTGRAMDAVLDRTNVSAAQATPANRVQSDSVLYARLGYGAVFADARYGGPSVGLIGYRKELNRLAIDVSFLNFQYKASEPSYGSSPYGYSYGSGTGGFTGNWLKLEVLRFATPLSDRSVYFGGGLSVGGTNITRDDTTWDGSGLQGELTVGYEIGRASTIRMFVQADAGLPFYELTGNTFVYSPTARSPYTPITTHRYAPSLAVSVGLGWQRGKR